MKTWCDDAITGVKQERGGTEEDRGKKKSQVVPFLAKVSLTTTGVFLERDPTHPLTPQLKHYKLSSLAGG